MDSCAPNQPPGTRKKRKPTSQAPQAATVRPLTQAEIAACAYLIWEQEGRPTDRAEEHWYEAEAQLRLSRLHEASHITSGDGMGI
jgi:hypothetical protein